MAIDQATTSRGGAVGLGTHGITPSGTVWWNLTAPALYEQAIAANKAEPGPPQVREVGQPQAVRGLGQAGDSLAEATIWRAVREGIGGCYREEDVIVPLALR